MASRLDEVVTRACIVLYTLGDFLWTSNIHNSLVSRSIVSLLKIPFVVKIISSEVVVVVVVVEGVGVVVGVV